MALNSFYPGTTKCFRIAITHDGGAPDITGDVVTFRMKDHPDNPDAEAVVTKVADVTTAGLQGVAIVALTPSETKNLEPRTYHYDIEWCTANGSEYVLDSGHVLVLVRVSDTPA